MSSSSLSRLFLDRCLAASSITDLWLSTDGLGSDADRMLLRWLPRRHLLFLREAVAMLMLASVAVAERTAVTSLNEDDHDADFL